LKNPTYFLPNRQDDEVGHQNDEYYQDEVAEPAPRFLGLVLLHVGTMDAPVKEGKTQTPVRGNPRVCIGAWIQPGPDA